VLLCILSRFPNLVGLLELCLFFNVSLSFDIFDLSLFDTLDKCKQFPYRKLLYGLVQEECERKKESRFFLVRFKLFTI
jgi:hypothetical protein